jgi:hypothetical protein
VEPVEGPHGDGVDSSGACVAEDAVEDGPRLGGALDLLADGGLAAARLDDALEVGVLVLDGLAVGADALPGRLVRAGHARVPRLCVPGRSGRASAWRRRRRRS